MASTGPRWELEGQETSQRTGNHGLAPSIVAALLAVALFVIFYSFKSNSLIGDGLRHLPALRTILPGEPPTFRPKPWLEIYRNHYDELVVHNHFIFGAVMRTGFWLQQKLGIPGDAFVAIQIVNSASAAVGAALFFLLGLRLGLSTLVSLGITLGLSLSPVYLMAATNIVEVALALPFFIGTLLLLSGRHFTGWIPLAAGALAGLAAIAYAIAGSLAVGIALAVLVSRLPLRSSIKPILLFLFAFGMVFGGIWVTVLIASGYHTPDRLLAAIFQFPAQGTFPKVGLASLIATPVGLTEGFLPVLPDGFTGLRSLYRETPWPAIYAGAATLFVCGLLVIALYVLFKRDMLRNQLVLSCIVAFLLVEAACVKWDNYYQKLHLFAAILCWVMLMIACSVRPPVKIHWPLAVFVVMVCASGLWILRKNVQPSQLRANAQQLQSIVGNGELITSWSDDVMHMDLYSDAENILSLPDFSMARHLDSKRVQEDMQAIIQQASSQGRRVYFYGLFDENSGIPSDVFESRFRLTGITAYLSGLERKSRPIARLPQAGGQMKTLYMYVPE